MGKTLRLTINERSHTVEVGDLSTVPIMVRVDGEALYVRLESGDTEAFGGSSPVVSTAGAAPVVRPTVSAAPAPGVKAPPKTPTAAGGKTLSAPMPGVVLAVRVKAGDRVKRGEEMCLLESMKMELNILAGADGVVKKVCVSVGQNVAHGTVLVEFE